MEVDEEGEMMSVIDAIGWLTFGMLAVAFTVVMTFLTLFLAKAWRQM